MIVTDFQREVIKELCTKQAEPGGSMTIDVNDGMHQTLFGMQVDELVHSGWIATDGAGPFPPLQLRLDRHDGLWVWEGRRGPLFETQFPGALALAGVFISSAELAQASPQQLEDASMWTEPQMRGAPLPKPLWLDLLEGPAIEEGCEVGVDVEGFVHSMTGPSMFDGQENRLHRDPRLNYQPTTQVIFKQHIGFAVSNGWANGDIDVALQGDWGAMLRDLKSTWRARPLNLTATGLNVDAPTYRLQVAPISKIDGPTYATEDEKRALAILRQLVTPDSRAGAGSQWPTIGGLVGGKTQAAAEAIAEMTGMSVERARRAIDAVTRAGQPAQFSYAAEDEGA